MRILLENTCLVVVDVQEKFVPHIHNYEQVLKNCEILVKGSQLLNIPTVMTEQNPSKLGETVAELKSLLPNQKALEKIEFSCFSNKNFQNWLSDISQKNVILCGIETHICVLQTAIDLKQAGYNPIIAHDAVSSRSLENKHIAMDRFRKEGIIITSTESILFELMYTFEHPASREISKLIK